MTLRLNGSTSGYTEIDAPAAAGSNTLYLPTSNGAAGNILGTDGSGNLSWVNGRMVLETSQTTTSGTFKDFTGIPSWVKRVTVMFSGVSTGGTSPVQIQIGAGSITTSGYVSSSFGTVVSSTYSGGSTSGFPLEVANPTYTVAATVRVGTYVLINISGNSWVATGTINKTNDNTVVTSSGSITLSGTLDRIRLTTVNGTDTFDAGSVNILYEG
jgi:hypothetical protein